MRRANSSGWGGSGTQESEAKVQSPESWRSWKATGGSLPNKGGAWRRLPGEQRINSWILNIKSLDWLKNAHLSIVEGILATLSWRPWSRLRGRGGRGRGRGGRGRGGRLRFFTPRMLREGGCSGALPPSTSSGEIFNLFFSS